MADQEKQGEFEKAAAELGKSSGPEVAWDKPAPTGPPTGRVRNLPSWFNPVLLFFRKQVEDEGLLADLCLEKAVQLVQETHDAGLVGIDHFPEATGGRGPTRTDIVSAAVPLAVELYRQCLQGVASRAEEFQQAVKESVLLREHAERSKIVTTG